MPIDDILSLTFGMCDSSRLGMQNAKFSVFKNFPLPASIRVEVQKVSDHYQSKGCRVTDDTPLFLSQRDYTTPISKWQAYRILNDNLKFDRTATSGNYANMGFVTRIYRLTGFICEA
jgi:hypothetical protein